MKKQNKPGFTLIELLIAVFILSVVLLAISSMVYSVMQATSNSKETSTATTLMQDKMETLKNTRLTSLTPGNDSVQLGNIDYLRQWSISTTGNIRTINVTVNWINRGSHTVTMTTLRGD
ncbi:MAG: prepilin-type N-terminal cleavage/methylation domain-containing protein [Thermodesulfobacteriota bacterium]|jgi:prepilin-type N-terminal cleavage/methylation domain-containing protein